MTKREYFSLALTMPIDWLRSSAANPSPYMTRMHVALTLLAIRWKTRH
jgi:hypothetical protein